MSTRIGAGAPPRRGSEDEWEGVLAHELAHVRNRDVVITLLGEGVADVVATVAQWAVLLAGDNDVADVSLAIVVGQVAQLLVTSFVFAIPRYRENVADSDAVAEIQGEPLARDSEAISRADERAGDSATDQHVNARCIFGEEGAWHGRSPPPRRSSSA